MSPPAILDLQSGIQRRLRDVDSFQIPRLRDCGGPLSLHTELANETRNDIQVIEGMIESLEDFAEDERTNVERQQVRQVAYKLRTELERSRQNYRQAVLTSREAIRTHSRYELDLPKESAESPAQEKTDDPLQAKTNEVTDALRRTMMTMQQELERSVLTTQLLDESTTTLRSTQTLYDRYNGLLSTAGNLVKQIEKADWYDKLLIFAALGFFLLVVAFIIKRRILDKAARGVGWWVGGTAKILTGRGRWKSGAKYAVKAASSAASSLNEQTSSIAAAITTTATLRSVDEL